MPKTFNSSGAYTAVLVGPTQNDAKTYLQVRVPFTTAGVVDSDFTELDIEVNDAANNPFVTLKVVKDDIDSAFSAVPPSAPLPTYYQARIPYSGNAPNSVNAYFTQNSTVEADDESWFKPFNLVAGGAVGAAPTFSVEGIAASVNDSKIVVSGTAKIVVRPPTNATINKVFLVAIGTKADAGSGTVFREELNVISTATVTGTTIKTYTFSLSSLPAGHPLKDLKADSTVRLFALAEIDNKRTASSTSVSTVASVRLGAPTITSVTSLQDQQITVNGSIRQRLPTATNERYTILAQELVNEDSQLSPMYWQATDKKDLPVPAVATGIVPQVVLFSGVVTKIGEEDLITGRVYAFAAVKHNGNWDANKSVDIAETGPLKPSSDQSALSNSDKTGVTIEYANEALTFGSGDQTGGTADVPALSFSPQISPPLVKNELINVYYGFSSSKKPTLNKTWGSHGDVTFPADFFRDPSPQLDDEWTLSVRGELYLNSFVAGSIGPAPALTVVSKGDIKVVVLYDLSIKVKKSRDSSTVPTVKAVRIESTNISGATNLIVGVESAPIDKKELKLMKVELQVGKNVATDSPDAFVPLFQRKSTNPEVYSDTFELGLSQGDVKDAVMIGTLYSKSGNNYIPDPIVGGNTYSARAYAFYEELKYPNVSIKSLPLLVSGKRIATSVLNAPKTVLLTKALSANPSFKAVQATFSIDRDVSNAPGSWGVAPVTIHSATAKLIGPDGAPLPGVASKTVTFTDEQISAYNSLAQNGGNAYNYTGTELKFENLDLAAGELIYLEVVVRYKKVTSVPDADGGPYAFGGKNDINVAGASYIISPAITITSAVLSQSPAVTPEPAGDRKVNGAVDSTLTIRAKVDVGTLTAGTSDTVVNAILVGGNNGDTSYHNLAWDSTNKEWFKEGIVRSAGIDYKTAPLVIFARNAGTSNLLHVLSK